MTIREAHATDHRQLLEIWLRSVRATHSFLTEEDIQDLLPLVRDHALPALELWVLCDDDGTAIGFVGLDGSKLEALFIDPAHHRQGGGRMMVEHARSLKGPLSVDVNEQNPQAVRFYEACGFVKSGRSERDGQGKPFPLLHLCEAAPRETTRQAPELPQAAIATARAASSAPIRFYSKFAAYFEFSNFSPHGFELDGAFWPTVEHYFQAQKFASHPEYQEKIRRAPTARESKTLGRTRAVPLRSDWESVKDDVMRRALRAKFTTHEHLKILLLETADRLLVEDAPTDYYWGCGRTGTGKNRLGVLLMKLREELLSES